MERKPWVAYLVRAVSPNVISVGDRVERTAPSGTVFAYRVSMVYPFLRLATWDDPSDTWDPAPWMKASHRIYRLNGKRAV